VKIKGILGIFVFIIGVVGGVRSREWQRSSGGVEWLRSA